eukprot:281108-Pelagomonas_calceolata.AAC.2
MSGEREKRAQLPICLTQKYNNNRAVAHGARTHPLMPVREVSEQCGAGSFIPSCLSQISLGETHYVEHAEQ